MSTNPHQEPGITDEAAIEGHDFIERAEREEQRLHGKQAMTGDQSIGSAPPVGGSSSTGRRGSSTIERIKDALHLNSNNSK